MTGKPPLTLPGQGMGITWGLRYWSIALIVAALAFLGPELYALATNYHNTLSDYARHELNLDAHLTYHTVAWWLTLVAWGVFVVVITLHIWGNELG